MSGLKKISGISSGSHRAVKLSRSTSHAPKAPKMPATPKSAVPKMPHIKATHGVAGTSQAHHQKQVVKAMSQGHIPRPSGSGRVPGVPVDNPAPGPSNAFE